MQRPYPRRPPTPWKGSADVRQIRFLQGPEGRPIKVGEGKLGTIYAGKVKFHDGKIHRVAIKQFKWDRFFEAAPEGATMNDFVRAAEAGIQRARKLGIPIPKMALVKMPTRQHPEGEYVLVSQLFASTSKPYRQRSHFKPNKSISKNDSLSVKQKALELQIKLMNKGINDTDLLAAYRSPRKGVKPIDMDGFIFEELERKFYRGTGITFGSDVDSLGHQLNDYIVEWARNSREYELLLAQAYKQAKPALRKYLARRGSI